MAAIALLQGPGAKPFTTRSGQSAEDESLVDVLREHIEEELRPSSIVDQALGRAFADEVRRALEA